MIQLSDDQITRVLAAAAAIKPKLRQAFSDALILELAAVDCEEFRADAREE
jgi:hypothetical protein